MAEPMCLGQVLTNRRCFSIPDYQRDFARSRSNVLKMCSDILEVAFPQGNSGCSNEHFIGTLVTVPFDSSCGTSTAIKVEGDKLGGIEFSKVRHVVDGQQRLTTLCLFVHELLSMIKQDLKCLDENRLEALT